MSQVTIIFADGRVYIFPPGMIAEIEVIPHTFEHGGPFVSLSGPVYPYMHSFLCVKEVIVR